MKAPWRKNKKRGVFDVFGNGQKSETGRSWRQKALFHWFYGGRTVNLKPEFWRSRPWLALFVIATVGAGGVLLAERLLTRAEVADFYPTVCLGDWENPYNAQGEPENLNFASSMFNASNSAVFAAFSTQIFCGGFLPPDFEPVGEIKRVGISFIWNVTGGSEAATASASEADSILQPGSGQAGTPAVNLVPNGSPQAASSTIDIEATSNGDVAAPSSTPAESAPATSTSPETNSSSTTLFFSKYNFSLLYLWHPILIAFAEDASILPTDTTTTTAISPPPETTAVSDTTISGDETTSGGVATSSLTDSTTTIILGPPLTAVLSPQATSTGESRQIHDREFDVMEAETTSTTDPSAAEAEATGVAFSALPAPPVPPDENFLEVSYSTDGVNWIQLSRISPTNWQNFTISLPISNWDDLKKLQVKVSGIPTSLAPLEAARARSVPLPLTGITEIPKVYLDGMFVEAEYELPPALIVIGDNEDDIARQAVLEEQQKEETGVFDPEIKHTCAINPSAQKTAKGKEVFYEIKLSASYQDSPYELLPGNIPADISANLGKGKGYGDAMATLRLDIGENATAGSFNMVIVYREINRDGIVLSAFCRLNLIVE